MNGFDVQAIGWIVTRDLCTELARALLGLRPRLERAALEKLASRWLSLNAAVLDDQRTRSYAAQILWPRRIRLSERSEAAMKAFIAELVAFSPRMYGYQGLRGRCFGECVQLVASFLCSVMLGHYGSTDIPTLGQASLGFFLLGCWSFAVTVQLYGACRLVGRLDAEHAVQRRRTAA